MLSRQYMALGIGPLLVGSALAVAGSVAAEPDQTSSAAKAGLERKTLTRVHDPVVIRGREFRVLGVDDTTRLSMVRYEEGRAVAMPFQIDQRDEDGEIVVGGPRDFLLDDNDDLVFMAKDAGDRAAAPTCKPPCRSTVEIEVVDPRSDSRAWAYLSATDAPPPRTAAEPYVTFDVARGEARSRSYSVAYAPSRNYFTGVSVAEASGGRNVNLLRQSRMHGSPAFDLMLTDLRLDFTEQNTSVELDGVRAGPVRAVRRARLSVDLGPMFPELPNGIAYTYHYATSYLTPSRVSFPWIMVKTLRDFRFENTLDFQPQAMPMQYFDADTPEGVDLASGGGEIRTTDDHEWWVHSGAAGTMLHAFVIPERWREWGVVRGTVVRPGSSTITTDAAGGGAAGYTLLNMTHLREAGSYDLLMASVVLSTPFRPGDEEGPMAMLHAPLRTTVRRLP